MPAESEKTTVELRSAAWRRSSVGGLLFCGGGKEEVGGRLIFSKDPYIKILLLPDTINF
jgi:hypothetical protein